MALLSAPQIAAIAAEAPLRQFWRIYTPTASGNDPTTAVVVHDDADSSTRKYVVDPGKRKVSAYNVSMKKPGALSAGAYSITCANDDGMFYTATVGNFFFNATGGTYQAAPQECHPEYILYVWSAGAWSELLSYRGRITEVEYRDVADMDGPTGATVDIKTEQVGVSKFLRDVWTADDGDDTDTTINVYPQAYT